MSPNVYFKFRALFQTPKSSSSQLDSAFVCFIKISNSVFPKWNSLSFPSNMLYLQPSTSLSITNFHLFSTKDLGSFLTHSSLTCQIQIVTKYFGSTFKLPRIHFLHLLCCHSHPSYYSLSPEFLLRELLLGIAYCHNDNCPSSI